MIVIDKAILHILDFKSGMTVYSDEELTVQGSIETFLLKHIEKSWHSQEAKPGKFYDDSNMQQEFKEYLAGNLCRCTGYQGQYRALAKYFGVEE